MDDMNIAIEASESLTARARINIAISEAEKPLGSPVDKFEGVWRAGFDAGKTDGYARGLADGLRRAKRFLELEDIEQKANVQRTKNIRQALSGLSGEPTLADSQVALQRQRATFEIPQQDPSAAAADYLQRLGAPGYAPPQVSALDDASEA